MKDIINQVQSPFTDENIQELIKRYIYWDGEFADFYRMVNGVDASKMTTNPFLTEVNNELWRKNKVSDNSSEIWNIILSEKNYLKSPDNHSERTELYRIYLNLKGEEKARVIQEYVQQCEKRNKGYKFKYSKRDGRDDEIVIITDAENLSVDIQVIQQILEGIDLGNLPLLVGRYTQGIGIAEEYVEAPIYSYTELRLDMIPKAITKYILDNTIRFIEYCDEKQVKLIDDIRRIFSKRIKFSELTTSKLPEESEKRKKSEEEKKAFEENISLGHVGFGVHITVVKELREPLRQYMLENSEKAMPEMISNYRKVCKAHGISEQGVFSLKTEQKIKEMPKDIEPQEHELTELQQELEKLIKLEKRTSQKKEEARIIRNAYQAELDREEQTH